VKVQKSFQAKGHQKQLQGPKSVTDRGGKAFRWAKKQLVGSLQHSALIDTGITEEDSTPGGGRNRHGAHLQIQRSHRTPQHDAVLRVSGQDRARRPSRRKVLRG